MSNLSHEKFHLALEQLQNISSSLKYLSYAFANTGNELMAGKLSFFSENINDAIADIAKHDAAVSTAQVNSAFQSSVNVLNAALSGVKLGEGKQ